MLNELIETILSKDPAARSRMEVILCYPGFHAVALHQLAHWLWQRQRLLLARLVSSWNRFLTGIEIHPGAKLGRRLFIDHGMGIVIGETAIVGDDVVLYHGVTLGAGQAARQGQATRGIKRHPTVGNCVVIGSGAEVQGDISVGDYARIASGAVVLRDVPAHSLVAGIPGRVIYQNGEKVKADATDFEAEAIKSLRDKIVRLEEKIDCLVAVLKNAGQSGQSPQSIEQALGVASTKEGYGTCTNEPPADPIDKFLHGAGI
jgi:serine O-acetyltransferase